MWYRWIGKKEETVKLLPRYLSFLEEKKCNGDIKLSETMCKSAWLKNSGAHCRGDLWFASCRATCPIQAGIGRQPSLRMKQESKVKWLFSPVTFSLRSFSCSASYPTCLWIEWKFRQFAALNFLSFVQLGRCIACCHYPKWLWALVD